MRGVRQQKYLQDRRFLNYFAKVTGAAEREGKVFFMDTGEGHEYEKSKMQGEDLAGWLIDESEAQNFEERYCSFDKSIYYDFEEQFCFAEWEQGEDQLVIHFRSYE